jgi:ATP-binding cassette subfamily F protein 3
VNQAVGSLSGGEKARLVLAMLVWQRPNLLLMDEPTNHLDLSTREALSMALNEFEGSVLLVSHDRALLREVCDEFWLVSQGGIQPFDGDLDDYQQWLLQTSRDMAKAARESRRETPSATPSIAAAAAPALPRLDRKATAHNRTKLTDQLKPLRNEARLLEQKIAQCELEKNGLEQELANAAVSGMRLAEAGKRLKQLSVELTAAETRWLELSTLLDDAQQQSL